MARASYPGSARAMALGTPPLAWFCAATRPVFAPPLTLARWDHDRLPLTVYFTGQTVDDQTRRARSRARGWRDLTAAELPARVEADRIDILIDLARHTAGGTLWAFARRMAPVQASFLGYPGSTGVPNIDWLIGDPVVTPPEADHLCSERVWRLPHTVFCFAPEVDHPLPAFERVARDRPLTFGSFNNIPKLTPSTIRLWSAVPEGRARRAPPPAGAELQGRGCRGPDAAAVRGRRDRPGPPDLRTPGPADRQGRAG
jgi:hypothetical protein